MCSGFCGNLTREKPHMNDEGLKAILTDEGPNDEVREGSARQWLTDFYGNAAFTAPREELQLLRAFDRERGEQEGPGRRRTSPCSPRWQWRATPPPPV